MYQQVYPLDKNQEPDLSEEVLMIKLSDDRDPLIQGKKDVFITSEHTEWLDVFQSREFNDEDDDVAGKTLDIYSAILMLRRISRVCLLGFGLFVILIIFIIGHIVSMSSGTWESSMANTLVIRQGNCLINIYNHDQQNIKVEYTQKGSMLSATYQKDYGMSGFNYFIEKEGTVELGFINYVQKDVKYPSNQIKNCIVTLYLPMMMQSLDFRCMGSTKCYYVSHDSLIATRINFTSESYSSLYVNSKTIQTDTLNYNSTEGGALYLNHLISGNVNIFSLTGPILVQSTEDFQVSFTSNSSSYCSSSIYIDGTSTNCDNSSSTICQGNIKQCQSSNCNSNLQKYSISTVYGTIYSNLIKQIGQLNENVQIYKSVTFDSDIEFDVVSKQEINKIKQEAFLEADLIVKISVGGNLLLQHSQNSFWVYFSNSAYAAFQPWWLSFFSATFLTAQTFDVDLQINNYFCPHTQVITIEQAYQLSNLIFKQFNQNVGSEGVSYINKKEKPLPSYNPNFNLNGIEQLPIRSFFTSESWYIMKLNQQLIEWQTLVYESTFIAIIVLSLLSAIILALIIRTLIVAFLMELECQTIKQIEQMQNYNHSQQKQQVKTNSDLASVMKQALKRIGGWIQVKYFFSLMSYQIYLYQRQYNSNPQRLFFKSLFRYQPYKNNESKQRLNDKQLKEMYDQFCYLSHCPSEPLKEEINLLQRYGFDLKEHVGHLGLAKIRLKNKILISNYSKLSDLEKQGDSIDYFFQTQFDFTGIQSDQIDSKDINHYYQSFMDEGAKFQVINLVDAAEKYNLTLVNLTSQELVKNTASTNYVINPHFNLVLEIISDPLKIIKSDISDSDLYTSFYTFWETVKYNRSNQLSPYIHHDIMDDRDTFINILDVIYPQGWFITDILITINFYFLIFLQLLPTLFFLILISTSYAPYSLNHPKSLLFAEDMILRPWSLYIYVIYNDPVITGLIIIFIFYFIISILLEMKKNYVTQYPEDIGFLDQVKNSDSVLIQSILNIQWWIFITGITFGLIYLCLVMEWLLLGAIINPNNFLVYASSVATLIATILQQINQAKQTYEFGKKIVLEYINKNYLSNVTLIASSLMQESLMLSNQISLPSLGEAFTYAEKAGFGTELRELCTKNINFFEQDQPGANSIEKLKQDYQKQKDNLFEKIVNKCSLELQQNFKMDKNLSEVLASINFKKFEDVEDQLAVAIETVTKGAIPEFLIKWVLKSTLFIMKADKNEKIPISKLLLELVGKTLMKDMMNPKMEQILSITIQYIYEFDFNGDNRELLLEELYNEIKLFTNQDVENKDILLLKYFMEFFLIIVKNPKDAHNKMNEIINNISSLMEIEELIKFILSFLFSSENDSTFRLGNKIISEPRIMEEYLISFIETYQLQKQEIDKIQLLIKIAIRFLKMNRLQVDKIFTNLPIAADKEKSYYYSTFLSNILQLAGRKWDQTFSRKFKNYDINDQIVIDTFFISSKFLWNQKDLLYMDSQFQRQQMKYQKDNDDSQSSSMIQQDQVLGFASQPRFEKLSDRKLTRLIANAMGMSIEQTVGCAVFLKGECDVISKHLSSFYNYLFYEIMSIRKAEYENLFRFFDLMSCSQFELVPYKVQLLGEEASIEFKRLFLNPKDQQTLWIFHPDFTQDQKLKAFLNSDVPFINDPIANHYKADRCSFYGYIQCELKGENVKKKEKSKFYDFLIKQFKCKMSIATLLFDLQNSFLQNRLDVNQINLTPLNGVKIRQEAFLKFLYLQDFNRPKHMAEAIMYFINQDSEEKQNNYSMETIAEHLNYFINIENTVNEMEVEIPSTIPFYCQHLRFLFVNKILSTKIPVLDSSVQCWVKYGIKFLIDHKLLQKTEISTTLSWVNLFFKLYMDHQIEPVRNIVQLYGSNQQSQFKIDEFIDNQINHKFSNNLFPFLQNFFQDAQLLKKTLRVIEGLAQVSHESNSSLTWIGNRIKYFFTLDQDCFSDFAVETVQKMVNSSNSDYKSIRVFFSIFDLNPDYVVINRFYGLKESTLRIIKFLAQAMTYKDKQIIIDRWSKEQNLLNALQNQLSINNFELLFNQLRLLNSDITDLGLIIKILRIGSNPNLATIYMQLLGFHLRDYHQDLFEAKKTNEYLLVQIRQQVTKEIMPQLEPIQLEIMELLHWFVNPDPLGFIIKLTQNSNLSEIFVTNQDQQELGLFIGSIVSILKQDPQCKFSRLSINTIRNQSALTQQLSYPKFLDMLGRSQSTLLRSALGLLKIFGIEPLLTLGILNDNINNQMMNTLYSTAELQGFEGLVNQISHILSPLEIFQIIDQENNEPLIGQQEIIDIPKGWNKNEGFSKKYPKSTIIFLLACKEIRNLLVYQKCKDKSQLYLIVSHYMDIILTYFDLYQQQMKNSFDKNLLNHIVSIGLCTSSTLFCKQQIVNFNFLYQECLMLPSLQDLHKFGFIQDKNDKYWVLFNDINSKIKKLDLQGIVDDQIDILLDQFLGFKNVNKISQYFGVDELQILYNKTLQYQQLNMLKCMVIFPYHQLSLLITKYPNKTLMLFKQQILPKLVSEDQLDLLDNHTTQNYDKLITYFIKYVTDKPILEKKQINVNQQFQFLYDLNEKNSEIKKMNFPKESIGLIQFLDQMSIVAGDWHTNNSYNMIIVAFYEPQSFELYERDLDKIDDPQIVATLMKLCLKYNLELNKLDFISISQNYSYYQFDVGHNKVNKNLLLKKQSLKLNQGIEKILMKYQGLNQDERAGIKLLIRAFLGDIEAWYLIYQLVQQKYELYKNLENRFEQQNSNQFLLTFLSQLKQKSMRSRKYSRNVMQNYSGLKIIMENEKDYIVQLLKYVTDTIPISKTRFTQKYENILEFMKLVLLQKVKYINEKSMNILSIEEKQLQVVTQLILFIIHNDQNSDTSQEFNKLELLIQKQQIFQGNQKYSWLMLKFIYMIKQTDDLNILIEQIITLFQSQPEFQKYSKYLCLLISLSVWINIKYTNIVFPQIEEQGLNSTLKTVLGYPYQWINNLELQVNSENFIKILQLFNENVGDPEASLFSSDQKIYEFLPDELRVYFNYYFGLDQHTKASQELIKVLHHKINSQGLGSEVKHNYKPIIDIIKQKNQIISPQLDLFVEGMPKLFNDNHSPLQKIAELTRQFSLFCNSQPLQELLTMQSKILINAPNKYDRMFEIFCNICNIKNDQIKTTDIITLVHQILQIHHTLTGLMHTEKNESVIFHKIVESLQTFKINEKPIFDKNILIVFEGIYALKYKQFDKISRQFFQIMQTTSQNEIQEQLMIVRQAIAKPLALITSQESLFTDKNVVTKVQHLGNVSQKLIAGQNIVFEDMFKLIDQSGTRFITGEQLHNFLTRTGIKISDHKMTEILVKVMGDSIVDTKTVKIDQRRFQMAFEQIQEQTLSLALDYLGISKQLLIKAVITIVFYLLILIIFILIGIQAFSIPGTFGSIINSLLPALGGVGLSKRSSNKKNQLIDLDRIEEIVRKSIEIIQSSRI